MIKPTKNDKSELLDIGSFFRQKDFPKKPEMLKTLWSYHLKLIQREEHKIVP